MFLAKSILEKFVIGCICLLLVVGRAQADDLNKATVRVVVSENFSKINFSEQIELKPNSSVIDLLKSKWKVETNYGGAFVVRINDQPRSMEDSQHWFYYINGILADVGALSYFPKAGDHVLWDFHPWTEGALVSAIIGAYPQPFVSGYGDGVPSTRVYYSKALEDEAGKFVKALTQYGAKAVTSEVYSVGVSGKFDAYSVVIAPWADLKDDAYLKGAHENFKKSGFFVRFNNDNLAFARDFSGDIKGKPKVCGAILALSSSFNTKPVWIISGSNEEATRNAIGVLTDSPEKFANTVGALICGDTVSRAPLDAS